MHPPTGPTLVSLLFLCRLVASRQVHQLVYSPLSHLDDWAGVQGFEASLRASQSRQLSSQVHPTPSSSLVVNRSAPDSVPTALRVAHQRRGTFTSNVCPINTQTTVFVSVDGSNTITLSSTVGPRATGIPGDAGTSDGADSSGNSSGTLNTGGESLSNKEGLITGLVIVVVILLASFCALCSYFYKKRRNAQLQRLSLRQPGTTSADLVRQMGTKGLLNLSSSRPILRRPHLPSTSLFTGLVHRIKARINKSPETRRDSQSSELLEWKRQVAHNRWSEVNEPVGYGRLEKSHSQQDRQISPQSGPEVITSPPISVLALPSAPAKAASTTSTSGNTFGARSSTGSAITADFVPFVQRRVSAHPPLPHARLSAVRPPIPTEQAVRLDSSSDLGRDSSPRRNSKGEPLSPSAWIAGFGPTASSSAAGATNADPFNNPSYVSSSGHDERLSDAASPMSSAYSLNSDPVVARGRPRSQTYQHHAHTREQLSMVAEVGEVVRPDGASDIMSALGSAFGDRPTSRQSDSTTNEFEDERWTQVVHYHPLSDVEEVLTPVADERLSIQPGQPLAWRSLHDSLGSLTPRRMDVSLSPTSPRFRRSVEIQTTATANVPSPLSSETTPPRFENPFTDDASLANAAAMIPPAPRAPAGYSRRPPGAYRRKSEATSLHNGILPSEKSGSISITGTSIARPGSIDTSEWDDPAVRKREEENLFYRAPSSASVIR